MSVKAVPILKTKRLLLRGLIDADKKYLLLMRSDPQGNRYIERALAKDMSDIDAHLEKINLGAALGENTYWILQKKENPELMGNICFWNFSPDRTVAELGYQMRTEFQRHGYMDEALKAVLQYGFEILHLKEIEAFTQFENMASIELLLKNGFELQEDRRDQGFPKNRIYIISHKKYFSPQ
ncbi:MAG: GNAT family N-acetyltransferase [Bacteroidetes bacterium]|nr:GNAT family N-acetyltransferase [Bacteroidota bacterium]